MNLQRCIVALCHNREAAHLPDSLCPPPDPHQRHTLSGTMQGGAGMTLHEEKSRVRWGRNWFLVFFSVNSPPPHPTPPPTPPTHTETVARCHDTHFELQGAHIIEIKPVPNPGSAFEM